MNEGIPVYVLPNGWITADPKLAGSAWDAEWRRRLNDRHTGSPWPWTVQQVPTVTKSGTGTI